MINRKIFSNPDSFWRGKPFWSWNGKLEKDELIRQIDVMKEMGMGGFFMHSRTGLETEYLGEEWFGLINTCADYADSIGMEAWLYDEDRWPSGLAGGMVSQYPEFRQKAILLEIDPKEPTENVILECSCDLDGAVCTNLGNGTSRLRFSITEQGKSGFYNGWTYIDTMNREATEAFLECTHERYLEKCGDRLGKSIKGVFTDEPHRGSLMDIFGMYREDGSQCVPYTQKLFEEFETRFGYDLRPKLPELFLQVDGKRISPVKWHFTELLQQLFLENYAIPCKEWCERHNMVLTGHILHEDSLTAQTAMSGSMMRYYQHMTAPGVDCLGLENRNYWVVKQLASTARQTGKKQLLSEMYGITGWDFDFVGHKRLGDWQALLGINLRSHHLSWYTMRGEAKRDYPASILHQSPWYLDYKHVEDYFARFGLMMAQGEPVCDLLVLNPVESVWAQVHLGWSNHLEAQVDAVRSLEERYAQLFTWLLESQIDFDYGDEGMMAEMGGVSNGRLQVGQASYSTVVVSGLETIRSSTLDLLKQFAAAGGKVVIAGDGPTHVDAEPVPDTVSEVPGVRQVAFDKVTVLAEIPVPCASVSAPDIFGQLRKTDEGYIFATLNVNPDERRENVKVRIKTDLPIARFDCETGEIMQVPTSYVEGWQTFVASYPKGGQNLWVASSAIEDINLSMLPEKPRFGEQEVSMIQGPFSYRLSEPNVCVLDMAQCKITDLADSVIESQKDGEWQVAREVLKIDEEVRDRHGVMRRGGEMLQPWFIARQPVKALCAVTLRFGFEITEMPEWVDLVIEEPENFEVTVNATVLTLKNGQQPSSSMQCEGGWVDIAFHRVRIPRELLKVGANEIILKTTYGENSNLEAIYLLGDFGVTLDGITRRIGPLPDRLEIGDLCKQNLPFYSGAVIYEVPLPEGAQYLRLPEISGACAKVRSESESEADGQVLGWDPFEAEVSGEMAEVEIVLTRRNTFGPLHDRVNDRSGIGPMHFTTEGEEWSDECVLIPSGILSPIEVACTAKLNREKVAYAHQTIS